ncbi:unnamed protein product, partial [Prorocentrum cordatum]
AALLASAAAAASRARGAARAQWLAGRGARGAGRKALCWLQRPSAWWRRPPGAAAARRHGCSAPRPWPPWGARRPPSSAAAAPPHAADADGAAHAAECQALLGELQGKASAKASKWEKAALEGRTILGYGRKDLGVDFAEPDAEGVRRGPPRDSWLVGVRRGPQERAALDGVLQRQLQAVFLAQSSTIEQDALYQRLKKDLLRRMRRRRKELEVKDLRSWCCCRGR